MDITNFITYDRARPLHVYDAGLITGSFIEARRGRPGESVAALDGKTYPVTLETCVIADGSGAIGLGGVMGGASTGCSEATREVFIESAWFDPILTAQTGRETGIVSDAQYRFARGDRSGLTAAWYRTGDGDDPRSLRRRGVRRRCWLEQPQAPGRHSPSTPPM